MNLQRTLIFVRHAESIGNTLPMDVRAGMDIPNHAYHLTDRGREQAKLTGEWLKENGGYPSLGCQFFTSTFLRTIETMQVIMSHTGWSGVVPTADSRLDEKWDGIFHQLSPEELRAKYRDQIRQRKLTGYYHYRAPGGESCPDVEERIRSFFRDNGSVFDNQTLFIVGHGRWFLVAQKLLHGLSVAKFLELKEAGCPNCSVTIYRVPVERKWIPDRVVPWRDKLADSPESFA